MTSLPLVADAGSALFDDMVGQSRLAMVASDLRLPDQPIVYVNNAFVHMTGFARDDVLGRNCRFLQGDETDASTVAAIRETVEAGRDGYFELLNYDSRGKPFWNGLHIGPIVDEAGETVMFFGAQRDVTAEVESRDRETLRAREMAHRMGNLLAIVGMMVRNSARGEGEDALRAALEGRLAALSDSNALVVPGAHAAEGSRHGHVGLRTLLRTVLRPISVADQLELDGPDVTVPQGEVTNIALVVHELGTNALKHGALSTGEGRIAVDWRTAAGRVLIDWREHGGPPVGMPDRNGLGTRLLKTIASASHRPDAELEYAPDGVRYRFDAAVL